MENNNQKPWLRAILLMDLNAFFASVEQRDFPHLRGKPVAITNGAQGSTLITCSYEARQYGLKTGMRLWEARKRCPQLIIQPSRHKVYGEASRKIMAALEQVTPDIEIFSVDEAFLDVTHCQNLHGSPEKMARMVKEIVYEVSGLLCSVGVSGDKTTAKYAAGVQKPDGLTIIPPWEAEDRLKYVAVTELCGIGEKIGQFLANYGVLRCKDMKNIPMSVLAQRYGNIGRRMWLMCQGKDPEPVNTRVTDPKSVGHGKVLPPGTRDEQIILNYFFKMSDMVAARMRKYGMKAQTYHISYLSDTGRWGGKYRLVSPEHDGQFLFRLCRFMMDHYWGGEVVRQVQVTAVDPQPSDVQIDLFAPPDVRREKLHDVVDEVNDRYGDDAIKLGRLLSHQMLL